MLWIIYSLLSPATYSIVTFVDKYLLEKQISDYRGMPIYGSIMAAVFGVLFWILSGFPVLALGDMLLIMLSGALTIWGAAFYFGAMAREDTSNVLILIQLQPVFVLLLSVLFLKEVITFMQLLGFFLILSGTLGVSLKKDALKFRLSSAFWFMIGATIFWALANVVFKFVVDANSFSQVVSFESLGLALGGLLLYLLIAPVRHAFQTTTKTVSKKALGLIFLNEGLFVVSRLFAFLAISMGSVTLVNVIGSTSVFFGIIYGWVLTMLYPHVFSENLTKKGLFKKGVLAVLVFVGIYLMIVV